MATPASSEVFRLCFEQYGNDTELMLQCVVQELTVKIEQPHPSKGTTAWLLVIAGALVFVMQLGFAMLCAGCVRKKNVANTLLKSVLDASFAAISFFSIGFALAFGGQDAANGATFVGNANFFLIGDVDFGFWFYEYACASTAVTIVAGTLAERCLMSGYNAYSLFMTAFVYPIIAHAVWSDNGFLSVSRQDPLLGVGAIDFAGSGVVHLTGGVIALIATCTIGARKNRFHDMNGELRAVPKDIPGHSISLQVLGTFILWFGWYGFNGGGALVLSNASDIGSVAALTATTTTLAAASGGITAMLTNMLMSQQNGDFAYDLPKTMNGALCGLVAVTASCGVIEPWAAIFIGCLAGLIYLSSSHLLRIWRIDDAVDGIPVHFFGGLWGVFAVGLFASPNRLNDAYGFEKHVGFFYSLGRAEPDASLLSTQIFEIFFILGWTSALMIPFFLILNRLGWLRPGEIEEIAGLDACYQHAVQEDQEQLKRSIKEELRRHGRERKHSDAASTTEPGSV